LRRRFVTNPSEEDQKPENQQETVRTHLERGRAWFEMGKYDRAIADYTKAIALSHHGHDYAEDNLRRLGVTP
jgi:tetratricopeptide (TPR) repeat protein